VATPTTIAKPVEAAEPTTEPALVSASRKLDPKLAAAAYRAAFAAPSWASHKRSLTDTIRFDNAKKQKPTDAEAEFEFDVNSNNAMVLELLADVAASQRGTN